MVSVASAAVTRGSSAAGSLGEAPGVVDGSLGEAPGSVGVCPGVALGGVPDAVAPVGLGRGRTDGTAEGRWLGDAPGTAVGATLAEGARRSPRRPGTAARWLADGASRPG